jgi:hypothetical protein
MSDSQPPGASHRYDNPRLSPTSFLLEVMPDPTVPIHLRIEAATMARPLLDAQPWPDRDPDCVIKITDPLH